MAILSIDIFACRTRAQLAAGLGVPPSALDLVTLASTSCRRDGCTLPAVTSNYGSCILCSQTWFPREFDDSGEPAKYRRGYGLFGPQYQRRPGAGRYTTCCCSSPLCEKIGYANGGMFRFPPSTDDCLEAARVLGLAPSVRQKIAADHRRYQIAVWHFHPDHRYRKEDGSWALRNLPKYHDAEGKAFSFPPPNASVQRFVDQEITVEHNDDLPLWVRPLSRLQRRAMTAGGSLTPPPKEITPTRGRNRKKRGSPESEEIEELRAQMRVLQVKLDSALEHNKTMSAKVEVCRENYLRVCLERDTLKADVGEMTDCIRDLEARKLTLSYDDLRPGGTLAASVGAFTFFPDFASNDAFLNVINFTEACEPGEGLCENMVRYHHVSVEDRLQFQTDQDAMEEGDAGDGLATILAASDVVEDRGAMEEGDAGDGLATILAAIDVVEDRVRRPRKVHWKTEWLMYCFYARCNTSMTRIASLFGVGETLVHDVVYAWANVLCTTLAKFFPMPTRSQMLRAYPKSVIKKFGHANICALLDATEIGVEVASMKTVNAIMYSAYKHGSTMKWLAACDPIGAVADPMIGAGHGGSISDPVATAVSTILESVPFGMAVEVDKGFLIENECALLGIVCIRPMKFLNGQTQQSDADTGLTQKVGKTRIVIEQCNGQMKSSTNYFDSKIKVNQIGLADRIFRSGFLLQNFKLPFIQERCDTANAARPCKAKIRWYGATDDGLVDVRPNVEMWGLDSEVERWAELRANDSFAHLTNTEISELVLEEDWPSKMKAKHEANIDLNNS